MNFPSWLAMPRNFLTTATIWQAGLLASASILLGSDGYLGCHLCIHKNEYLLTFGMCCILHSWVKGLLGIHVLNFMVDD